MGSVVVDAFWCPGGPQAKSLWLGQEEVLGGLPEIQGGEGLAEWKTGPPGARKAQREGGTAVGMRVESGTSTAGAGRLSQALAPLGSSGLDQGGDQLQGQLQACCGRAVCTRGCGSGAGKGASASA